MLKYFLSLICLNAFAYEAILTDIEGTTTSISFVHDVLFPYAKDNVQAYVERHQSDPEVLQILAEVQEIANRPGADLAQLIGTLHLWMEQDRKITPLKTLQGMMWKEGYEQGNFQGHVYEDVYEQLMQWKSQNVPLYVYSSGSVPAQKLLFSHTGYGDLTPFFSGYFDTRTGSKKEASSYTLIASQMALNPQDVLFLSDSLDELHAAHAAGMKTLLLCREGAIPPVGCPYDVARSFTEIAHPMP